MFSCSIIREDDTIVYQDIFSSPFCLGRLAGHGGNVEDTNGDEADGMDETLCPVDVGESGHITDDEVFEEVSYPQSSALFSVNI